MKLPEGPIQLLRYFEQVFEETGVAHFEHGAEMCRRWLELLERKSVEQRDVDSFIEMLEKESSPGSGWTDLGMQFRWWAKEAGFRT